MRERIFQVVFAMPVFMVAGAFATTHLDNNNIQSALDVSNSYFHESSTVKRIILNTNQSQSDAISTFLYNSIAQNNLSEFIILEKDIIDVQNALIKLGYDVGKVDGIAGRKTVEAIVELQQNEGLPITGEIDQPLLEFLGISY